MAIVVFSVIFLFLSSVILVKKAGRLRGKPFSESNSDEAPSVTSCLVLKGGVCFIYALCPVGKSVADIFCLFWSWH